MEFVGNKNTLKRLTRINLERKVAWLHPPKKLTWNTKMEVRKMSFLVNWMIFRFHVNFQGSCC